MAAGSRAFAEAALFPGAILAFFFSTVATDASGAAFTFLASCLAGLDGAAADFLVSAFVLPLVLRTRVLTGTSPAAIFAISPVCEAVATAYMVLAETDEVLFAGVAATATAGATSAAFASFVRDPPRPSFSATARLAAEYSAATIG